MHLRDLLALEDDPTFVELVCPDTGVLAWPAIRNDALRIVISAKLYARPIGGRTNPGTVISHAASVARAAAFNATHRPTPSRALILTSGAGLLERDGRAHNRYSDYFAEQVDSWTLEGLIGWQWPSWPYANQRRSLNAPFLAFALAAARARVAKRHRAVANELVELVARRARDVLAFDLEPHRATLVERCGRRLASLSLRRDHLRRWLHRVQPSLILNEEGCFGHMAIVNATAREHGVIVAEIQHGWVSHGYDAYNVAPTLEHSPAYRRVQPHAFLGYGELGNRQFNAPVARHAIGNPHRETVLANLARPTGARRDVLVLGDGIDTEVSLRFCTELARVAPHGLRVIWRPHPLERHRAPDAGEGFAIDRAPDIHASLTSAHAVIGEVSTGLFDAVGLAERVVVWDTPKSRFGLGDHPFATASDAADLAAKLADPACGRLSEEDAASIWAPGWRERFRAFIEGQLRP